MDELTARHFDEFFSALWKDKRPFSWQRVLAKRVIENADKPWPDAIALPTASGKTACIDIAVFALAAQAERLASGKQLTAPRRIFFVVDRRIIVHEACKRARIVAAKLRDAKGGILKQVADRLRFLAAGERQRVACEDPLAVFELRGGMYRSEAWARSPLQPTVVSSTVDQLGSRLLFRAYGRGPGMWPVYAGLIGNDSLVLLDEAHCAQPFLQTLQAVARYRSWAEEPLPTRFYPVVMSATPPDRLKDVFRDESDEPTNPNHPLGKRQLASKPTVLSVAAKAKGNNATNELAEALAAAANDLVQDERKAVVVFTNRVATARRVHGLLAGQHGSRVVLLTGRMRSIDKDDAVGERLKLLVSDEAAKRKLEQPVFVVATQTLEVGADLDFDALVTECASLDALRQRFGRLNRTGRPIEARAVVLIRADQTEGTEEDPVYGAALANTWAWLNKPKHLDKKGQFNFGVARLGALLPEGAALAKLNAPSVSAPVMLPAHVDCWVQTSPEPEPTPDVALFLRGPKRGAADVQVCWRADIDLRALDLVQAAQETLTICPPAAAECVSVPIHAFKAWMIGPNSVDDTGDVEAAATSENNEGPEADEQQRTVLRWRGRNDIQIVADPKEIRAGDIVVIPALIGGWEGLGDLPHEPDGTPTLDWGDRAHRQIRAKAQLRLHPAVVAQWPEGKAKRSLAKLASDDARGHYEEDPDGLVDRLIAALTLAAEDEHAPAWLREVASELATDKGLRRGIKLHPLAGLIVQGSRRLRSQGEIADEFSDEDDAAASGTVRVPLFDHLPGVAAYARRFANGCGLPKPLVDTIERAALLHDLGKADPRFQALLRNGNPWDGAELLAKSNEIPQGRSAYERARIAAGYPKDGRHELLSVRLVETVAELFPDESHRDLILHLVATHHGYCRPFAPVVFDDEPIQVTLSFQKQTLAHSTDTGLERLDSGVADRFWRLVRRHGWWGLAWLEGILRLADHRRSEAEAAQQSGTRNAGTP